MAQYIYIFFVCMDLSFQDLIYIWWQGWNNKSIRQVFQNIRICSTVYKGPNLIPWQHFYWIYWNESNPILHSFCMNNSYSCPVKCSDQEHIPVTIMFFFVSCKLLNSYSASHNNWCTATLWNRIMTAQCEGMGEVGSARYEPALLPPCPSIRVLSYSNCQRSTQSHKQFKG